MPDNLVHENEYCQFLLFSEIFQFLYDAYSLRILMYRTKDKEVENLFYHTHFSNLKYALLIGLGVGGYITYHQD